MTAQELLKVQIDEAGFQLGKVLEGIPEANLDAKPLPSMMSVREQVEHLAECYVAAAKLAIGESHEWGSYAAEDKSWDPLTEEFWRRRGTAAEAILTATDPKVIGEGVFFLAAHDNYHVGQLCAVRIALEPEWNPYSIYR